MAIRIHNVPAVVEWTDTLSTPRSFLHLAGPDGPSLQLHLYVDEEKQTAIFKIRVRLDFGEGTVQQGGDYLYLWVHPSDVVLLLEDPVHCLQGGVSTVLRGPTICLRLVLSKPASMVAPSDFPLPLRDRQNPQMLNSLILLAKQTVFTIYVERRLVPDQEKIQQLCEAFCNGTVKQHPRHDTLRDFYKGRDAMIIEDLACFAGSGVKSTGLTADGPSHTRDPGDPPSYAKQRPPSPSLFAQQPSNKRQRVTAGASTTISPNADDVYTKLLTEQKAQMDAFFSLQQAQMAKILDRMRAQVDRMPDQVIARVDKRVNEEMAVIWDKKPSEWVQVTQQLVQQEVEDALERSLPGKMEEFKEIVMQECLDHLKDDLEGGMVSIKLPR